MTNTALKTIAVDLTPITPGGQNGGAKVFVLELIRQLAQLAPTVQFILLTQFASHDELRSLECSNVTCKMILNLTPGEQKRYAGLKRYLSPIWRLLPRTMRLTAVGFARRLLKRRRKYATLLTDMGADLLFCPFTSPTYYEPGIPVVATVYDLQHKAFPQFFSAEELAHRDYVLLDACRKSNALVAISNYSRDDMLEHFRPNINSISTIYLQMAQRVVPLSEDATPLLSQYQLQAKQYLLYPANFWKHKNHEMVFVAFNMACASGLSPEVKLVCTGAPIARQAWLKRAANNMGLDNRIIFPGYLSDNQLAALLMHAGGLIFPSLFEGFGIPVIEAMALGIPVACSQVTSLPEIAQDAALLFDPRIPNEMAAAMLSLLQDNALREKLIAAGQRRVLDFSDAKHMATEYLQVFHAAVKPVVSQSDSQEVFA